MKWQFFISALVIGALIVGVLIFQKPYVKTEPSQLKKFSSSEELKSYLNTSMAKSGYYATMGFEGQPMMTTMAARTSLPETAAESVKSEDYSATNIQVAGVDEADIVKNDGKYIYTMTGEKIVIIDAFPAESGRVLSEIKFNDSTPSQIFVSNNTLVVFGSIYNIQPLKESRLAEMSMMPPYYRPSKTFLNIYDISDRKEPKLLKNYTLDGSYYNSRMIGNYVYAITNQAAYNLEDPLIPQAAYRCPNSEPKCFDVWYFDVPESNYQFTIVNSINLQNPDEFESKVFLMGYTQNLYVSANSMYITYSKRLEFSSFFNKIVDAILQVVPADVSGRINEISSSGLFSNEEKMSAIGRVIQNYSQSLMPEEQLDFQKKLGERMEKLREDLAKEMEKTIIHKISIKDGKIEYKQQGEVPGNTLNQFSMDEYNGYFRIATTTDVWSEKSKNHAYILDDSLQITGKLEDLASGERIYSARFIGTKGYLVTFRQIDPLFVIDLENPGAPKVLGYLKIPGVSDYLHPYDNTHLIGIGRDASEEGQIKGLKISLFDISDVQNPKELSKYLVGERGTDSEALRNHKAFLFSRSKNLLAIPVRLVENGKWDAFQGAYVFDISINEILLKGRITHSNQTDYDYSAEIRRSLYMDDILYTLSEKAVKMNSLKDLSEINAIIINPEPQPQIEILY